MFFYGEDNHVENIFKHTTSSTHSITRRVPPFSSRDWHFILPQKHFSKRPDYPNFSMHCNAGLSDVENSNYSIIKKVEKLSIF